MRRLALASIVVAALGCGTDAPSHASSVAGGTGAGAASTGDPAIGRQLVDQYACLACHQVPGFEGPQGSLGPSLAGIGSRPTIGGRVPNSAATLTTFLQNPQAVDPQNRMMSVGVSEEDARHIAAFLFTLQ